MRNHQKPTDKTVLAGVNRVYKKKKEQLACSPKYTDRLDNMHSKEGTMVPRSAQED
jgi:hypothetical protein